MSEYTEKFKNPRWQKKRLKIMESVNFECEVCFSKDKTLNVHHGYYEKGYDPWDYDDDTLWCLCEDCHEGIKDQLRDLHFQLAKIYPTDYSKLMKKLLNLQGEF